MIETRETPEPEEEYETPELVRHGTLEELTAGQGLASQGDLFSTP